MTFEYSYNGHYYYRIRIVALVGYYYSNGFIFDCAFNDDYYRKAQLLFVLAWRSWRKRHVNLKGYAARGFTPRFNTLNTQISHFDKYNFQCRLCWPEMCAMCVHCTHYARSLGACSLYIVQVNKVSHGGREVCNSVEIHLLQSRTTSVAVTRCYHCLFLSVIKIQC